MLEVSRRKFVELATGVGVGLASSSRASFETRSRADGAAVYLSGDGLHLSPGEFSSLLADLCRRSDVAADNYCLGGEIERFERRWAELLGKETAVFMPSGTLANQLALRVLAGDRRRVIVPETSHVYNDTGDACQTLSQLTLIPLAPGLATFTRAEVERALEQTAGGRVKTEVGAILVESPVRRLSGALFDREEMQRVCALGRERGIGLHLDGARLFIASAYTGIAPAEYAAPFDTVYVSLWKYFNSGIGAILAGPKRTLDGMYHTRRMFGGNLFNGWSAAVVAGHFMDGFLDRFRAGIRVSEELYRSLGQEPAFTAEPIPNGTNVTRLELKRGDPEEFRRRLGAKGIHLPPARDRWFTLGVNESWGRTTGAELARAFRAAVG
jgi:threonine aldolase